MKTTQIAEKDLGDLFDDYSQAQGYIKESLEILATITGHRIDLPNIDATLNELLRKTEEVDEVVKKVFNLGGLFNQMGESENAE